MTAIGSLVFCTDCGDLLNESYGDAKAILICNVCGAENRDTSSSMTKTSSKTRSKPAAFPSLLRSKRSTVQTLTEEDIQTTAVIRQTCSECGREEMRYYTQQLRSADEGTTVFYSCECGHKFTSNN